MPEPVIRQGILSQDDRVLIKAVLIQHLAIGQALLEKTTTIKKLMKMLFGAPTEKAQNVLPDKPPET